jgi:hypothetical protein
LQILIPSRGVKVYRNAIYVLSKANALVLLVAEANFKIAGIAQAVQ